VKAGASRTDGRTAENIVEFGALSSEKANVGRYSDTNRRIEAMKRGIIRATVAQIVTAGVVASWMHAAAAQNSVQGKLEVDGRPVAITQVYAYAKEGFFDKKKQDVVVLLCDAAVPAPAVRDPFAYKNLVAAGKVHCVRQTIDADKHVINFDVGHQRFGSLGENGGSTEHVFEAQTFDGKTIAGRSRTRSPQKSFKDVPYTYDITFSAAIEPKK
jgi:hypothetical protein